MAEATAQAPVTCELCKALVRHWCITCSLKFCDRCVSLHDKSHHVILFIEKLENSYEMCKEHKETVKLYCRTCGDLVCQQCLISRHKGHAFEKIEEAYETEILKFDRRTKEIERSAVFGTRSCLEKARKNLTDVRESVSQIRSTMKGDAAYAKQIIDDALKSKLQTLDLFDSTCSYLLSKQENIIRKHLAELETDVEKRKNISESKDRISFLKENKEFREKDEIVQKIPTGVAIQLPEFSDKLTDQTKQVLQDSCGSVSFIISDTSKLIEYVEAPPPKHWKPPAVVKTLSVEEYLQRENLAKICRIDNEYHWVADQRYTAHKVTRNGKCLYQLTFSKSENLLNSDIICYKGSLVFCSNQDSCRQIYCPECRVSWYVGYCEYPCCMCVDGDCFLVLYMFKVLLVAPTFYLKVCYEGGTQEKEKIFLDQELQCILGEKHPCPNFMVLNSVSENIVISYNTGAVVVGSTLDGKLCFQYRGQKPGLKGQDFDPQGLATDRHGHILIADFKNSCIHMLESRGNFLTYIATSDHGLDSPVPLSIDSNGLLWIGEFSKKTIIVLDYLV